MCCAFLSPRQGAAGLLRGVTLRQVRAFDCVARCLSFARAADELRLSPSAVSLQIKELELTVQLALVDRQHKTLALTPAGEVLLPEVARILATLDHAGWALERYRTGAPRRVGVGMVGNAQYFVPRLLARFREQHAGIELSLEVRNRERLLDQLQRGEIDLAIMGTPPDSFVGRVDAFAAQPLGIVAPPRHPLAGRQAIAPSELVAHDFIVREHGSGTRSSMERFFRSAQIDPPRVMEMGSNEAIKQAVMAAMGLAYLSLHSVALELHASLLVALDVVGLPLMRPWCVVSGPSSRDHDAISSLRRFILETGGDAVGPALGDRPHAPSFAAREAVAGALHG